MDASVAFQWFRALHIAFMVCWFAGIFYLPRLFVNHAMCNHDVLRAQFRLMERKLYRFMTPFAWLTVLLGLYMLVSGWETYKSQHWMQLKLLLVALLVVYHIVCGHFVRRFQQETSTHSHVFYRWFNELPVLLLFGVIFLVVLKPF